MVAKQLIVAVFLLGASWAQRDGALDGPALTKDMADQCIRNGGVEAYNKVERAVKQLPACYNNLADSNKLLQGIEDAERLGRSVNEVYTKISQYFGCLTEVTESLKPCYKVGENARRNLEIFRNVVDQLLQYICQEDGAVITSFIAAGGLKCLYQPDTGKVLEECSHGLRPIFPQRSNNTINNMFDIDYDDRTCGILYEFQKCVVQKLKSCSQEVGKTAQSLIRSLRVSTPCKDKPNSASALTVTILSSLMATACLLLV